MFEHILKQADLKKTKARMALLEVLEEKHCVDITVLQERLIPQICDQATLFRTLKTFMEKGLVSKSKLKDQVLYEYRAEHHHHHHHHFICNQCKKIIPFDGCELDYFHTIAKKYGFTIQEHTMEFYGICQECKAKREVK